MVDEHNPERESNAERLQRIYEERKKPRPCFWCQTLVQMRSDQKFCSSSCRINYHALVRATQTRQMNEEREELNAEITSLREQLAALTK